MKKDFTHTKIGILGGGQLGKMLVQVMNQWSISSSVLDPNTNCSAASSCTHFVEGNFKSYETVLAFSKDLDLITIEIENVNTEALAELERKGKRVYPQPGVLEIIKDKGLQKEFYRENELASPSFILVANKEDLLKKLEAGEIKLPLVQKARTGGYDGRGVHVIKGPSDLEHVFDCPSVLEDCVAIDKELSVIVARNSSGEVKCYPPVEMIVDEKANLLDMLVSPAQVSEEVATRAKNLAKQVIEAFDMVGVLAVELFLDKDGKVFINECAPRAHNSGHQTIEGNSTSQYEQIVRSILNLPLGDTGMNGPTAMINLLGAPGYEGVTHYEGLDSAMREEGVHLHLYGKRETKPYRKMGHVTITGKTVDAVVDKAKRIKNQIKIIA